MSSSEIRIIDANLNRASEGLRVLEDIARLVLNDSVSSQKLKDMRHAIVTADMSLNRKLLQSRDSEADVGRDIMAEGQGKQKDLPSVVVANSRRVQESLRTLEEMAKLPDVPRRLESEKFKHARFALYTIEKELLFKLTRKDRIERLKGLHVILDTGLLKNEEFLKLAGQAIKGGAVTIQLHDKVNPKNSLLAIAGGLKGLCDKNDILFIMHSHIDIALLVEADGIHLEPGDLPVTAVRKLLPADKIIGCAVTNEQQAIAAHEEGADYLSVKLNTLPQIRKTMDIPLVTAMGADTALERVSRVDAVAVLYTALVYNIETEIRQIIKRIEENR